ncbi:MAG: DNA replication/repair protein RecF [Eubacterium sp.]|nr:DNA replication/repair protein RecF [Eubacterium sp.]
MKINKIYVDGFRNISALEAEFEDTNIIWGENAQGKTNLIEAIYLFTGAKSFRGAKESQLIGFERESAKLKIEFESNNRSQSAEINLGKNKTVYLNGIKKKNTSALGEEIKTVVFSPIHLSMIKEGPRERRHFVDGALCQIKSNYRKLLKEYQRALIQRNTLLKDMYKNPELDSLLYIWNQNLAKCGAKIIFQRLKYIEKLLPYVKDIFSGISSNKEELDLKYKGAAEYGGSVENIEKQLLRAINESRGQDLLNRATTVGPHRDDIDILINSKSARIYASQGQQRSAVIAIKLAEASLLKEMTNAEPIALLDDVMSELDEKRQDYILNNIKSSQVFITCCDKETILRLKQGKTIHIENGRIAD